MVAVGEAGNRTKTEFKVDVARVRAGLPEPERDKALLLVCRDRYDFAVCLVAAWSLGHRVALPPNGQPETLRHMAADDGVQLMLHDSEAGIGLDLRELLGSGQEDDARRSKVGDVAMLSVDPGQHLVTVWTSGSTGEHQRHEKTARQLCGEARVLAREFAMGPGARVLATVPPHHIYGLLFSVLVPLVGGAAFVRGHYLHAGTVAAAVQRWRATILVTVPAHLRALKILERPALDGLLHVVSSGAPLPASSAAMLRERLGLVATEVLGSTETGGIAVRTGAGPWKPLPGVKIEIEGEKDEGRLLVDSPFLPEHASRPFRTQDVVRRSAGGFEHLGRIDGVVKVGGKRVSLAEVQDRFLAVEGVDDVAVTSVEVGGARGTELVALVVAPGWAAEALRSHLRPWLDPVVIPRRLRLVDAIPRGENGKVMRTRLLQTFESTPSQGPQQMECGPFDETVAGEVTVKLRVPRNLRSLRGHFRGFAVVPGAIQLEQARSSAQMRWPQLGEVARVLRLKFKRTMRPGAELRLVLRYRRAGPLPQVQFIFLDGNGEYSAGSLEFRLDQK